MRMEYNKFKQNRSVDPLYLNVPTKYCINVNGSHQYSSSYVDEDDIRKNILIQKLKKFGINNCNSLDLFDIIDKACNIIDSEKFDKLIDDVYKIADDKIKSCHKKEFDKEFTIIEFLGKHKALCAWRNTNECKIGKTFVCPIITKNKKSYILYKNQKINI